MQYVTHVQFKEKKKRAYVYTHRQEQNFPCPQDQIHLISFSMLCPQSVLINLFTDLRKGIGKKYDGICS